MLGPADLGWAGDKQGETDVQASRPQALMRLQVWGGSSLQRGYFYKPKMLPRARLIYS